jgi:hypothetical protein
MSISIRHAEPAAAGTGGERVALGLVLGVWFLAAAGAADAGWLIAAPGRPPLAVFAAIAVPVGLFSAAYALSRRFREYVRAGDPVLLTYIQAWRVIGLVFLVLMSFGLLPGAFAVPAGWGDVAVGVSAPFVARWLAVRGAGRIGWSVIGWHLLGILDFAGAVGTATAVRTAGGLDGDRMDIMVRLPLSLIPTFGVPVFFILHLAAIAQVRASQRAAESVGVRAVLESVA